MREWFKGKAKNSEFKKKLKALGADYIEEEYGNKYGVFIIDVKGSIAAIKLDTLGNVHFGSINESCMNFVDNNIMYCPNTFAWMVKILTKIKNYKD